MPAPVPTFTETITLTTGVLPILLAKLLFLKGLPAGDPHIVEIDATSIYHISGAVLGNVLAEAPERLLALSKLSRQEFQEVTFFKLS